MQLHLQGVGKNLTGSTASVVAGVTGVFFVLDDDIKEEIQSSRSSTTDDLSEFFERVWQWGLHYPRLGRTLSLWSIWRE